MTLIAILGCLCVSFVFSGVESGLLSVNRVRLRHYAKAGDVVATALHSLLKRTDHLLVTVTTFATVFRIFALALLYSLLSTKIGILGAAAVIALVIPLLSLFLVVLPKPLFQRLPLSTLVYFARVLVICQKLMRPLFSLVSWLASPFAAQGMRDQSSAQSLAATVEIGRAASHLSKLGKLSPAAAQLIRNILRSRNTQVQSLTIPLQNTVHIRPETSIPELLEIARKTDIERIPILESRTNISGVIDIFDVLLDGIQSGKCPSSARRIVSVSSTAPICTAIRKMRAARTTLCTVTDKTSGKIIGIATLESLLRKFFTGKN